MEMTNPTASCSGYQHQTEKKDEDCSGSDWNIESQEPGDPYHGRAFTDAEDNIKFYPPLYRQRYEVVREILKDERWSPPPSKVVEFGCAELAMCQYFKQVRHIREVLMVDIDSNILDYYACRAAPLTYEYLSPRENPLRIEVLCGSVADCDVRLLGANAVVCIELIEHLEIDIVEKLEKTIFGFIQPEIAIFTTPNSDFNVLLKGMQGKFRHFDHKFEWSRNEFSDWTKKILTQYPFYQVEISGVGSPPEGNEEVGYCSQLALFIRKQDYIPILPKDAKEVYTSFRTYDHPAKEPDIRSDQEKLSNEVIYQSSIMARFDLYQGDYDISKIPLVDLTRRVQSIIPTADEESVRSVVEPASLIEEDGKIFILYNLHPEGSISDVGDDEHENQRFDEVVNDYSHPEEDSEERWDVDPPLWFLEQRSLAEYHMGVALIDNALNLVHERQIHMNMIESDIISSLSYDLDSDVNSDGDDVYPKYEDFDDDGIKQDCEWKWNSSVPECGFSSTNKAESQPVNCERSENRLKHQISLNSDLASANVCAASSPLSSPNEHDLILSTKREPITDSGVDLSPLLNSSYPQDEIGDIFPCGIRSSGVECTKTKDLPKSTSVEVLHLDDSCTLKRRAGLEFVEFAPSTSVALCYTGQKYDDSDKIHGSINLSMSSERKSLDGSLVRDVGDSCSLDFAGDSGYPNSSSLPHDVDVDLTPEQVDDISSENDERSNPSLSEDEHSDLSDGAPALLRRFVHPRHPIVPIVFENVENGDLANNNRDGEGNNAVAQLGDEREFVALVHEGEMQPLLAAPVVEEVLLPNNADPFPDWLIDLLRIEEDYEKLPPVESADDCDEGLGEDTV